MGKCIGIFIRKTVSLLSKLQIPLCLICINLQPHNWWIISNMYKSYGILFFLLSPIWLFGQSYFQQEVNYKIDVRLNDINHSLSADMEFEYINHSPQTLDYIVRRPWIISLFIFGPMRIRIPRPQWPNRNSCSAIIPCCA